MTPPSPQPAPDRSTLQTHAIILIVLGAVCGSFLPSIFGIIALTQLDTNPASARTMNKVGWILLVIGAVLIVLVIVFYLLVMGGIFSAVLLGS